MVCLDTGRHTDRLLTKPSLEKERVEWPYRCRATGSLSRHLTGIQCQSISLLRDIPETGSGRCKLSLGDSTFTAAQEANVLHHVSNALLIWILPACGAKRQ